MPYKLDPLYWGKRAADVRAEASRFQDPEARRVMLKIADDYEFFAQLGQRLRDSEKSIRDTGGFSD
jgi:hypothetical protein